MRGLSVGAQVGQESPRVYGWPATTTGGGGHMEKHRVADSPEPDGGPVIAVVAFLALVFALGVLVGAVLW